MGNVTSTSHNNALADGNFSLTNQTGTGNRATTSQNSATDNRAEIQQGNDLAGANNNVATVNPDVLTSARNDTFITQTSNGNTATVSQTGGLYSTDNLVLIDQFGSLGQNVASVTQSSASNDEVTIEQTGGSNRATVNQTGINADNLTAIVQSGNSNTATTSQNNSSLDNESSIAQSGVANRVTVSQNALSIGNKALIRQSGISSTAIINQNSTAGNNALITQGQSGISNVSTINQRISFSENSATVTQNNKYSGRE